MRSLLFVPGDSERKIEKALSGAADVLIFDLEDSVAPDRKQAAREIVAACLAGLDQEARRNLPDLYVRVNALDTGLTGDDVAAVMPGLPSGLMQPKTIGGSDVRTLSDMMTAIADRVGIDAGAMSILPVATETAASLFNLGTYVDAGPRLSALTWGAEDLSADIGASVNKDLDGRYTGPYELARTLCLLGAVSAGVAPVDTVFVNFRDEEGLLKEAEAAMRDGFTAKMAIHPAQVAVINEVFTPSQDAVDRAQRIVDAFVEAGNPGVIGLDGEMLDRPHLSRAEKLLARAAKYTATSTA
jgi:citrate lyase subunit beta/citryl-CoA lyase